MIDHETASRELLAKGSDATLLRDTAMKWSRGDDRLCRPAADGVGNREPGGRRSRRVQQNHDRERDWHMRAGTAELRIPHRCKDSCCVASSARSPTRRRGSDERWATEAGSAVHALNRMFKLGCRSYVRIA
jgi:hypothetical protein